MKHFDWDNIQAATKLSKLPAGGYVCGITQVEDRPEKECLYLEFDIAEGDYKNHYRGLYEARGFWPGRFTASYKTDKAREVFKSMLNAFGKSNAGFRYNDDEKMLRRKLIGLVIGYEEYISPNDGNVKQKVAITSYLPVQDIRDGKFEIPKLKTLLSAGNVSSYGTDTSGPSNSFDFVDDGADVDLPFA